MPDPDAGDRFQKTVADGLRTGCGLCNPFRVRRKSALQRRPMPILSTGLAPGSAARRSPPRTLPPRRPRKKLPASTPPESPPAPSRLKKTAPRRERFWTSGRGHDWMPIDIENCRPVPAHAAELETSLAKIDPDHVNHLRGGCSLSLMASTVRRYGASECRRKGSPHTKAVAGQLGE